MREIKFRAWDVENKSWIYSDHTDGWLWFWELVEKYHCKLMQFTGLYDKNGKEIYEGDVINLGEDGFAKPEVIIFDTGSFGMNPSWFNNKSKFVELNKYCNRVFEGCVEVIGNIYENPKLLK